eukprot:CAMPEP_0198218674 /NCGR_PEP_ID=MMETSP1445-20131203/70599_1 /TAXON_ID=36898 /ORGANISM="Pyramimonas sp., Strain CCMP2087" /LENGTH=45 /DNA_ID= /DNA_START= /DNA_END= /DNA_ORIENTATION=
MDILARQRVQRLDDFCGGAMILAEGPQRVAAAHHSVPARHSQQAS